MRNLMKTTKFLKIATLVLAVVSASACMKNDGMIGASGGTNRGGNVEPSVAAKAIYNGSVGVTTGNQLYTSMIATAGITSANISTTVYGAIIAERDKVVPSLPGTGAASNMTDGSVYGPIILAGLIADAWYGKDTATAVKSTGIFADLPVTPSASTPFSQSIAQSVFTKVCLRAYGQNPTPDMLSAVGTMYVAFFGTVAPNAQGQRDFVNAMITSVFVSPAFVTRL